jgi:putative FmdB family regulatory protein
MPTYEYACAECNKKFTVIMSFDEHDRKKPKCPRCKSGRVRQQLSGFFSKTSRKS